MEDVIRLMCFIKEKIEERESGKIDEAEFLMWTQVCGKEANILLDKYKGGNNV